MSPVYLPVRLCYLTWIPPHCSCLSVLSANLAVLRWKRWVELCITKKRKNILKSQFINQPKRGKNGQRQYLEKLLQHLFFGTMSSFLRLIAIPYFFFLDFLIFGPLIFITFFMCLFDAEALFVADKMQTSYLPSFKFCQELSIEGYWESVTPAGFGFFWGFFVCLFFGFISAFLLKQ